MKTRLLFLAAAVLVAGSGSTPSLSAATIQAAASESTTVTYCSDGGQAQTLDVYQPLHRGPFRPLLIVVHGGYWSVGTSALAEQSRFTQAVIADALSAGFTVASINYRLAPANRWPAQITDMRCAVRYMRATAARWGVDPARFAALGDSAGAQLVSLDALSAGGQPEWNSTDNASQSSALEAVVDCWGIVDLTAPGWSRVGGGLSVNAFHVRLGTASAALRTASPVTYVGPGAPPFLIIHGLDDSLVPPAQSTALSAMLSAAGDKATLVDVAHAGHGLAAGRRPMVPSLGALAQQTAAWLVRTLR